MKGMVKVILVVCLAAFWGCVSSGEYKARLADIDNLKGDKVKLEDGIKAKDAEIASLKAAKAKLEEESKTDKDALAKLDAELKKKESEKKAIEEKLAKAAKDNDDLTKENVNLKTTLASSKDELTKEVMTLKNATKDRESRIKLLEDDVLAKSGQIAILKDENNKGKEQTVSLETKLKAKETESAEKDGRIRQLETDVKGKDVQIGDLKKDIKELSTDKAKAVEEKELAIAELRKTHDNLVKELSEEIKKGEIEVTQLRDKLSLQLVEKILFDSGSADIKGSGKKVLDRVASILAKVTDKQIRIEGHTDNVPIGPKIAKKFATNWELSTARATNVVRYLKEKGAVDPKFLSAAGYAEHKPVAPNDTDENKARNRRIDIVLIPFEGK